MSQLGKCRARKKYKCIQSDFDGILLAFSLLSLSHCVQYRMSISLVECDIRCDIYSNHATLDATFIDIEIQIQSHSGRGGVLIIINADYTYMCTLYIHLSKTLSLCTQQSCHNFN